MFSEIDNCNLYYHQLIQGYGGSICFRKFTTFTDKMQPANPRVSDCNSESKNVASFIDIIPKPPAMKHSSYTQNTYDSVDKIAR